MEEALQEVDPVQVCVGGMIGLMEISASMETTRIRDSLVSLGGGWKAWLEREGAGTFGYGEVCCVPRCRAGASRGQRVHCIIGMRPGILRIVG